MMYCQSCNENPYTQPKEASFQLCGFWLCKGCYNQTTKIPFAIYSLQRLRENHIGSCYHVIWRNK